MQKEIGSIFPVSDYNVKINDYREYYNGSYFFSLCREALFCIAENYSTEKKVILIPAYTCQTVIEPFLQAGWELHFYPVDKKLCISENAFLALLEKFSPSVILFHPYYGKKLLKYEIDLLRYAKERGALIVQDLTQSIFSQKNPSYTDITVGSIRKWLGIPDGAFLSVSDNCSLNIKEGESCNTAFTIPQLDAMYLRGEYFRTDNMNYKQISIRLNKYAEGLMHTEPIVIHKISNYSLSVLNKTDFALIQKKRFENFKTLLSKIKNSDGCFGVINSIAELDDAPLYFPIYVEKREKFQRSLAEKSIYAPILWGVENNDVLVNETTKYIYEHLLAIPIDQRYDYDDMSRIADVINEICD